MSSTRRALTPARYFSTNASSTELSLRRQRSMIAVSNGSVQLRYLQRGFTRFRLQLPLVGTCPRILPRLGPFVPLSTAKTVGFGVEHSVPRSLPQCCKPLLPGVPESSPHRSESPGSASPLLPLWAPSPLLSCIPQPLCFTNQTRPPRSNVRKIAYVIAKKLIYIQPDITCVGMSWKFFNSCVLRAKCRLLTGCLPDTPIQHMISMNKGNSAERIFY